MKKNFFKSVSFVAILLLSTMFFNPQAQAAQKILLGVFADNPDYASARESFRTNLEKEALLSGLDVEFIELNTQGDRAAFIARLQELSPEVDMVYTTGTPNALAVKESGISNPVLFSAVANAVGAKLVQSNEVPGTNFTGAYCGINPANQLRALLLALPTTKTVGLLYNVSDPSPRGQAAGWKKAIANAGLQVKEFYIPETVNSPEGLAEATKPMIGNVDIIITMADAKVTPNGEGMIKVANENNMPTYVSVAVLVRKGALLSLGFNFKEGARIINVPQAIKILKGENPAVIPVETYTDYDLVINAKTAKKIGKAISSRVLSIASEVIQ